MKDFCTAKITSKGQVTIPKQIRDLLQIDNGDKIVFNILDNGNVELINKNNCYLNVDEKNKKEKDVSNEG